MQRADDIELRIQSANWPAHLHVNMKGVAELEQGLVRLLAIEPRQYCTQIQQRWVKSYFQQETRRHTGDHWTLVVVGDLDGDGLLVMNSMAAACRGECYLQCPFIYSQAWSVHVMYCLVSMDTNIGKHGTLKHTPLQQDPACMSWS